MRSRSFAIASVLLAVAACERGLSPSDSVDALMDAVTVKDSVEIARFVDLPRVAESAVDPLIDAAGRLSELDPDGFGQQTGSMGVQMLEQFRPMIAPLIEQLFWQMLLDPEAAQRGPLAAALGGRDIRLDEMASSYQGVVSQHEEGPDEIVLGLELAPDDADVEPITVDVRLERQEGYWKVVAFSNLSQTFGELMERGM